MHIVFYFIIEYGGQQDGIIPQHDYLRALSPMSFFLNKKHRKGEHRGVGDIFKALISMQKLSVSINRFNSIGKLY